MQSTFSAWVIIGEFLLFLLGNQLQLPRSLFSAICPQPDTDGSNLLHNQCPCLLFFPSRCRGALATPSKWAKNEVFARSAVTIVATIQPRFRTPIRCISTTTTSLRHRDIPKRETSLIRAPVLRACASECTRGAGQDGPWPRRPPPTALPWRPFIAMTAHPPLVTMAPVL